MKKIVVTDLNGPWVKGDVTYLVVSHLVLDKKLDPGRDWTYSQAKTAMQDYERRSIPYSAAVKQVMDAYDNLTRGKPKADICGMIDEYIKAGNVPLHSYCSDFLKRFKDDKREIVAVTSSPQEIGDAIINYSPLKFDKMIGSPHPVEGKLFVLMPEQERMISLQRKYAVISDFKKNNSKIDWAGAIGIGDTLNDVGIFDHTDIKVALNPDFELYQRIKTVRARGEQNWYVAPDCCYLADLILASESVKDSVSEKNKIIEQAEKICNGKIKVLPSPNFQLPIEYRLVIDAGNAIQAYGEQYGWNDELTKFFGEYFAAPAYFINDEETNKNNPRYNDPGRLAFARYFDEIWNKVPSDIREKLKSK